MIVVEDSAPIREVLTASYAALGLEWDPATAGAANDLLPGLDVKTVEDAVVEAYQSYGHIVDGDFRALLA